MWAERGLVNEWEVLIEVFEVEPSEVIYSASHNQVRLNFSTSEHHKADSYLPRLKSDTFDMVP